MFQVLNMNLHTMRTVLKNAVNEVTVCTDLKRDSGVFYTVVSIADSQVRREVARQVTGEGLFSANRDFVGSFAYRDRFCLVFRYQPEVRLCNREMIQAETFADRKRLAAAFLVACAEIEAGGEVGELLLRERNINLAPDGRVYFNYFIDFGELAGRGQPADFYYAAATCAFDILAREYSERYERQVDLYPRELQAFFKKKESRGFSSFNQILTAVKAIPDEPDELHFGVRRLLDRIIGFKKFLTRNSMTIFLAVLVAATVIYAAYQIVLRVTWRQNEKVNTSYIGMNSIGEVYLGDEDV
ncbi:hypothetical protein [Ligaoa zhengdingensis]|uniref:hypothetical protein n=2 Tax=Ligaoa zhengdingensis TaxID=2763658 RepID=UPI0031BA78C8